MSLFSKWYHVDKEYNSTKKPVLESYSDPTASGFRLYIDIYDDCDFSAPVIYLMPQHEHDSSALVPDKSIADIAFVECFNYVVISGFFLRSITDTYAYFFVDHFEYHDNGLLAYLKWDYLATYAQEIKSTPQFCLRSSVNINPYLIDTEYPAEADSTVITTTGSHKIFGEWTDPGYYMLEVAGAGGSTFYQMSEEEFKKLCGFLFTEKQEDLWSQIVEVVTDSITKTFLNPFQYLRSCRYLHVPTSGNIGGTNVIVGYWDSGAWGVEWSPSKPLTIDQQQITLPLNPYADDKRQYLNCAPYAQHILHVPYCGTIEIPAYIDNGSGLRTTGVGLDYYVDCLGNCMCRVECWGSSPSDPGGAHVLLGILTGNCASNIALADNSVNLRNIVGSAVDTAKSIATKDIAGAVQGIAGAASALGNTPVSAQGSTDGNALMFRLLNAPVLVSYFKDIAPYSSRLGAPCYKTVTPSSNGFYKVYDANVSFAHDQAARSAIKDIMETGFRVESDFTYTGKFNGFVPEWWG